MTCAVCGWVHNMNCDACEDKLKVEREEEDHRHSQWLDEQAEKLTRRALGTGVINEMASSMEDLFRYEDTLNLVHSKINPREG